MKNMIRIVAILLFSVAIAAADPVMVRACTTEYIGGIRLGHDNTDGQFKWTFSLINLTNSNVKIGAKGSTDYDLGSSFPYGAVYPPGNSTTNSNKDTSTLGLTTWKSAEHNKMFPDHCTTTVPFEIQDGSSAYNFSLTFYQDTAYWAQRAVIVNFQPPYKSNPSSFKYKTNTPYNAGPDGYDIKQLLYGQGIIFAISDKYVLTLYKNNRKGNGGNSLILVLTQKNSALDYRGNSLDWQFRF